MVELITPFKISCQASHCLSIMGLTMLKKYKILSAIMLFALLLPIMISCAKKPILIGNENPEKEIKQCIKYMEKKHFEDAIECLEIFKSHFPKSQWGIEAELMIGDNYFRKKDYLLAADSYQAFVKLHPTHPKVDYAYYKTGLSYLNYSPKAIDRDQEYLDDAIANFQIVELNFPSSPYININRANLNEANTRLAKRHFYIGKFYYKTGEYIAAIPRFKEVYENFKETNLAEEALNFAILSNIKLDRLEDAKVAFGILTTQYPKSRFVAKTEGSLIRAVKK